MHYGLFYIYCLCHSLKYYYYSVNNHPQKQKTLRLHNRIITCTSFWDTIDRKRKKSKSKRALEQMVSNTEMNIFKKQIENDYKNSSSGENQPRCLANNRRLLQKVV